MILVLSLYFGSIFYLVKKVIDTYKLFKYEEEKIEQNLSLNIDIDEENILYSQFNKIEVNDTNVLVCCTGDYKSMALLAIAAKKFENVHVLTINHNNIMKEFIENVCDYNEFTFHSYDIEDADETTLRYEKIDELCTQYNIKYVFEGHTMNNYSSDLLDGIFTNTYGIIRKTYRPFLFIDNITILRFFSIYDIPYDLNYTHYFYSDGKKKTLFEIIDKKILNVYSEWRVNLIEYINKTDNVFNTKDIDNTTFKGKYGFLFYHDFNKISFSVFKKTVNILCNEYNFCTFDNDEFEEYYMKEETMSYFINETYNKKIEEFEKYLNSIDLNELIKDDSSSENSFEELELSEENEEHIFRVDLNNDEPEFKLVSNISNNFREEYLDGYLYINVNTNDNEFFIYDINT